MRIKSVHITNFRCLQDVQVDFDSLTTLIGPNGAGKSSILRALGWFFNGEPALTHDDVYSGADPADQAITVEVVFGDLTDADCERLGPTYAPPGSTSFTAWRIWDNGADKMTARARSFPPFEVIRQAANAAAKKAAWEQLLVGEQDIGLPRWTSMGAADNEMTLWEQQHPERLEETEFNVTHLWGFNGQNKLSGLFDYVLVTADLRAAEQSQDGKKTIIGRILERAVDRETANAEFVALAAEVSGRQAAINEKHLSAQLDQLATKLTQEVGAFAANRGVKLHAETPDLRPTPATINVTVSDALTETSVDRQGHGFQRALLIAALKLLAEQGAAHGDGSVICLAIEEPELFQHPSQARVFARVLRELSSDLKGGLQVVYATHSPYFIDPRYFDQIRRVSRRQEDPTSHPVVSISQASIEAVSHRLDGFCSDEAVRQHWDQVCTRNLSEAFFADAVVLVEGDDDKGILDGIASRPKQHQLEASGIVVAHSSGKTKLYTPHAILTELGIPTVAVFDSDKGAADRTRAKVASGGKGDPEEVERSTVAENRSLLRYFRLPEVDFPAGRLSEHVFVWDDRLEDVLQAAWPTWGAARDELIRTGRGSGGKNSATYRLAAETCPEEPGGVLLEVIAAAGALVA